MRLNLVTVSIPGPLLWKTATLSSSLAGKNRPTVQRSDNLEQQITKGEYLCMVLEFALKFEHDMLHVMLAPKVFNTGYENILMRKRLENPEALSKLPRRLPSAPTSSSGL